MTQQQYIDYLRYIYTKRDGGSLSPSSIDHYGKEAMRLINERLKLRFGSDFSIYKVDDIEELRTLKEYLFNEPDFYILNKDGHQMYSAGMNRYLEFAEGTLFKGKQDILPTFDKPILFEDVPEEVRERRHQMVVTPDRNRIKIIQSEQAYNYTCQIDSNHKTFIVNKTNHQYMEGHHIIPLKEQNNFKYTLDCYANILVLCPTCHRFFHYAEKAAREEKLKRIYDERAERLSNSGIILDRKQFLEVVDTRPSHVYYNY